jgi:hypothetical protein
MAYDRFSTADALGNGNVFTSLRLSYGSVTFIATIIQLSSAQAMTWMRLCGVFRLARAVRDAFSPPSRVPWPLEAAGVMQLMDVVFQTISSSDRADRLSCSLLPGRVAAAPCCGSISFGSTLTTPEVYVLNPSGYGMVANHCEYTRKPLNCYKPRS